VTNKARLDLYLRDDEIKRQVKVAAANRGMTATDYCAQAIEERLTRDGERSARDDNRNKTAFLARMDKLREEIGSIDMSIAELVEEGRRR